MIECALELSNYQINPKTIETILNIGKEMLEKPIDIVRWSRRCIDNLYKENIS